MRLTRALRGVAVFEAAKGLLVLFAGAGLLTLLHKNIRTVAETAVTHLHLNPASHFPRVFIDLAANVHDRGLWALAALALFYAALRFTEAYGLWRGRAWAEWLAALSGALYVPFEIRELLIQLSVVGAVTLLANVAIVGLMAYGLRHADAIAAEQAEAERAVEA